MTNPGNPFAFTDKEISGINTFNHDAAKSYVNMKALEKIRSRCKHWDIDIIEAIVQPSMGESHHEATRHVTVVCWMCRVPLEPIGGWKVKEFV